jgi:toxin ParE1/3/4
MKLRWMRQALEGVLREAESLASEDERAAIQAMDKLMAQVEALRERPEMGRLTGRGVRELAIAGTPFTLVYRVNHKSERVEILRVERGQRKSAATDASDAGHETASNQSGRATG